MLATPHVSGVPAFPVALTVNQPIVGAAKENYLIGIGVTRDIQVRTSASSEVMRG